MNRKFTMFRHAFIVGIVSFFIFSANIYLDYNGRLLNSSGGFGVVNNDTIVIGTSNSISLIRDGNVLKTFAIKPIRRYVIGTSEDEFIRIYSPSGDIYAYDTSGVNVHMEHDNTEILYKIRYKNRNGSIESGMGIFYRDATWGYTRIILDNGSSRTIIYEEPLVSYISKVLTMIIAIYLVLVVSVTLFKYAQEKRPLARPSDRRVGGPMRT